MECMQSWTALFISPEQAFKPLRARCQTPAVIPGDIWELQGERWAAVQIVPNSLT